MSIVVHRSPEFVRDVENIVLYYVEQKTPDTALRFGKAVTRTIELLVAFPDIGPLWESGQSRLMGVRYFVVQRFKRHFIFYRHVESDLYLMRVIDGRRNLESLL